MGTPAPFAQLNELFLPAHAGSPGPEVQKESGKKMWAEYMKEAGDFDNRAATAWKDDADGILVFTGLFSATVGAFIIESYKKLSPDSGGQTVVLLGQISQQLGNFTGGTSFRPQVSEPFSPGASMIWVNAMWLMSLVLSITSALFATLQQQWARRYVEIPQIPSDPNDRARVRSFLFLGIRKYKMRLAIETAPTLLHLSVFLFFVGLVIFFFTIHKTVAIIVTISVGLFAFAYLTLTILPCIKHNCPYRTPMSNIWWYITHGFLSFAAVCFRWLLRHLHDRIVPYSLGEVTSPRQRFLVGWSNTFDNAAEKHGQHLKNGFRKSIVQGALEAPDTVDVEALAWWLKRPALAEESKTQDFLARIPGQTVVQLVSDPVESREHTFCEHLFTLLRSCVPGTLAVGLSEDERKARLQVCLDVVHHIASTQTAYDFDFVRTKFANTNFMREMWANADIATRVMSRSICALLARHLLHRQRLEESELGWLHDVTGEPANTIFNAIGDTAKVDHMNLKAFAYGVLSHQQGDLPVEHARSFTKTLAILMDAGSQIPFNRTRFQEQLFALIERFRRDDPQDGDGVIARLCSMFQDFLPAPMPALAPAQKP
ncbi:hypothetical protein BC826DRAFT_218504 [Russula brevipes]|nr:hypothetical protein BC826DRAFT_218504 [Russula brevipes]